MQPVYSVGLRQKRRLEVLEKMENLVVDQPKTRKIDKKTGRFLPEVPLDVMDKTQY